MICRKMRPAVMMRTPGPTPMSTAARCCEQSGEQAQPWKGAVGSRAGSVSLLIQRVPFLIGGHYLKTLKKDAFLVAHVDFEEHSHGVERFCKCAILGAGSLFSVSRYVICVSPLPPCFHLQFMGWQNVDASSGCASSGRAFQPSSSPPALDWLSTCSPALHEREVV